MCLTGAIEDLCDKAREIREETDKLLEYLEDFLDYQEECMRDGNDKESPKEMAENVVDRVRKIMTLQKDMDEML